MINLRALCIMPMLNRLPFISCQCWIVSFIRCQCWIGFLLSAANAELASFYQLPMLNWLPFISCQCWIVSVIRCQCWINVLSPAADAELAFIVRCLWWFNILSVAAYTFWSIILIFRTESAFLLQLLNLTIVKDTVLIKTTSFLISFIIFSAWFTYSLYE